MARTLLTPPNVSLLVVVYLGSSVLVVLWKGLLAMHKVCRTLPPFITGQYCLADVKCIEAVSFARRRLMYRHVSPVTCRIIGSVVKNMSLKIKK